MDVATAIQHQFLHSWNCMRSPMLGGVSGRYVSISTGLASRTVMSVTTGTPTEELETVIIKVTPWLPLGSNGGPCGTISEMLMVAGPTTRALVWALYSDPVTKTV